MGLLSGGLAGFQFLKQKKQAKQLSDANAAREREVVAEKARLDAVEEGQRRVRRGGRGLLAYIDDENPSTFGGS